jgi:hypothetical protein
MRRACDSYAMVGDFPLSVGNAVPGRRDDGLAKANLWQ